MNERIRELEKQAWEFVDKTWTWANANNPSQATLFKTKFAELIVEECRYVMDCNKGSDQNPGWNQALSETSLKIKQHFRVEE
jgi:hypothetical protein